MVCFFGWLIDYIFFRQYANRTHAKMMACVRSYLPMSTSVNVRMYEDLMENIATLVRLYARRSCIRQVKVRTNCCSCIAN